MSTINLTATQVASLYQGGDKSAREIIKSALGDKFYEVLPITERVKTFDDAVKELGEDNPTVRAYMSAKYGYSSISDETCPDVMAYLQLRIITEALNEGWRPQFTEGERRWYPYYRIISKEEYEDMDEDDKSECRCVGRSDGNAYAYGGLVCSKANYASSYSCAFGGSRLAFKSEELAEYAGKQFAEIYGDFCFIPKIVDKKA